MALVKDSTHVFAILVAAACATTALSPAAVAGDQAIWQGVVEYTLTRDGFQAHQVPLGCEVYGTFNLTDSDVDGSSPPETPSGNRTSVECSPSFASVAIRGRYPVCNATIYATVQEAAVVVGYASCRMDHADCAASAGVPCMAGVNEHWSTMGGCGAWLATGVKATVDVRCTITIAWI